jgi:hypothetical protein
MASIRRSFGTRHRVRDHRAETTTELNTSFFPEHTPGQVQWDPSRPSPPPIKKSQSFASSRPGSCRCPISQI